MTLSQAQKIANTLQAIVRKEAKHMLSWRHRLYALVVKAQTMGWTPQILQSRLGKDAMSAVARATFMDSAKVVGQLTSEWQVVYNFAAEQLDYWTTNDRPE